jgi:hypothetical protein
MMYVFAHRIIVSGYAATNWLAVACYKAPVCLREAFILSEPLAYRIV